MAQMLDLSVGVFEGCYGLASFSGPACQEEERRCWVSTVSGTHQTHPPTQLPAHTLQSLILGLDTTSGQGEQNCWSGFPPPLPVPACTFHQIACIPGPLPTSSSSFVGVGVSLIVGVDVGCVGDFGVGGVGV